MKGESDDHVKRRILQSTAANVFSKLVFSGSQLLTVALFAVYWNADEYADWIKLSTLPAIFSVATGGLGSVAANELTIEMGSSTNPTRRRQLFQATILLIMLAAAASLIIVLLVPPRLIRTIFRIQFMSSRQLQIVVVCFALQFGLRQLINFLGGAFRSLRYVVRGIVWGAVIQLAVLIAMAFVVVTGQDSSGVALAMAGVLAVGVAIMFCDLSTRDTDYRFAIRLGSFAVLKEIAIPSIFRCFFPFGHTVRQQGLILVLARLVSSEVILSFTAMRTLVNFGSQFSRMISQSISPELSIAYGESNLERLRILHRAAMQLSILLSLVFSVILAAGGPLVFIVWTQGAIAFNLTVFGALCAVMIVNTAWLASSRLVIASNNDMKLGSVYMFASSASVILAWALVSSFGMLGAAFGILATDIAMLVVVLVESSRLLKSRPQALVASLISWR